MNKTKLNNLINKGYKAKLILKANKKFTNMNLQAILEKQDCNIIYPIYYNHIKTLLNKNQIDFINNYNLAKNLKFNDLVDLNIKSKNFTINKQEMQLLTMYKAIKNKKYLEQN